MTDQTYCLFWIQHWAMCMTKAEWSSWTQAIGSVGAILGAIAVAARQSRDTRRLQREMEAIESRRQLAHVLALLQGAASIADDAQMAIENQQARLQPGVPLPLRTTSQEEALRVLEQATLLPMSGDAAAQVMVARRAMSELIYLTKATNGSGSAANTGIAAALANNRRDFQQAVAAMQNLRT